MLPSQRRLYGGQFIGSNVSSWPGVARQHLQLGVIIQTVAVQFGLLFFGVLRVVRGLVWRQYPALSSVLRVGGPQLSQHDAYTMLLTASEYVFGLS
jgi:hypothetical protein